MNQDRLRQLGDQNMIKNELVKQFTKHIEDEEADNHDESVVKVKLVVVGPSGAGKTSWVSKLINDKFNQAEQPTVGAKFSSQGVAIEDHVYNFEIWDVSGEDWCKSLVPMYLQYAQAAVVCYDPSDMDSYEQAKEWVEYVKKIGEKELLICFVGMKSDLAQVGDLPVKETAVKDFFVSEQKLEKNFCFPKVSAKTGENVEDVILSIAEAFHERGVKAPRASVLDVDFAYEGMVKRAVEHEDMLSPGAQPGQESFLERYVGQENVDKMKENMNSCALAMRKVFGSCFQSSKETAKKTYASTKTNAKELSKTLNRKSRRIGNNMKSGAGRLIRRVQGEQDGGMTNGLANHHHEEPGVPALEKLKG